MTPANSSGGIAQLVERLVRNEKVRGSNPLTSKAESVEVKIQPQGFMIGCTSGSVIPLPPKFRGAKFKKQSRG